MAYGKLKADTLVYDNSGSDVEVTISSLGDKAGLTSPDFVTDITLKAQAPVKFEDDTGGEYVGLKAPTGVTTYTVSLPAGAPTTGQVLKASSATALEWGTDTALTLLDEDNFATDSATAAASQQSVKAYVDTADALKANLASPTFTGTVNLGTVSSFTTTGHIAFEGSTDDGFETGLDVTDPTADRTVTLPDATGTVALLQSDQVWSGAQRALTTGLTDAATIAVPFAVGNNYSVTLGGNRTLGQPTDQTAGQSGSIFVTQDGTGSRTLAYHADWKWAGGTAPTLSTTAAAVDRIDYTVAEANKIHAVVTLDVK